MATATSARPSRLVGYPWLAAVVWGLGAAATYFVLAEAAPEILTGEEEALLLGIILGLVVGVALRVDARLVPAIAIGSAVGVIVRFSITDHFELFIVLVGLVIGAEVFAMTYLLRRAGVTPLRDPWQLVRYGLVVAAVAAVAGLLVALAGLTDPHLSDEEFLHVWRSWVIDDLFGLVCITPAVLMLGRRIQLSAAEALEYVVAIALTGLTTYLIFFVVVPGQQGLLGWPYIVVLGPIWIAVRFGLRAVAPVLAVQFWLALVGTVGGSGAFAGASPDPLDRLLAVELFAVVMSATIIALAVLRDGRIASIARVRESSLLLREVIDGSDALIFAKSYEGKDAEAGRYILVNRAWSQTTGVSDEETLQHSDRDIFPSDVSAAFRTADREVMAANDAIELEERNFDASGEERSYLSSKFPLRSSDGTVWGVGGIATDITEVLASREREARQSELLHAVFELSPTPAVRLSMSDGVGVQVHAANAAMCVLLGAPSGRIEDCNLIEHVHPEDAETALDVLTFAAAESRTSAGPSVRQREVRMRTEDGRMVWVLMSAAAVRGTSPADAEIVAQFEDFTARRAAEEALSDQAMRDAVTGLPNRRALHERMDSALQRLRRHPGMVTVMFCDLDHFKDINDSLGHAVGDQLLVEVAGRLRSALRPEDTIARLGGDEFVALGEGITDESAAMLMAMRLQDRLSIPWLHAQQAYRPTMSVGIAMTTDAEVSVDELLRRADLAMYRAKEGGRNRIEVYERSVDDEVQRTVAVQHDLRRAIDTGALIVHYQPIVRLSDEEVVGAEALVRMRRPDGVLLPPLDFVPQAEVTGLVVPMGAWVLQQALADLAALRQRGREYVMAVNVSPAQLREEGFARFVLEQAAFAGIDPSWLAVEVTETALIHDPGRSGRELAELHAEGIQVSLDDFGTGYSSLSWLTQFPVNVVKIDKSFTDDIGIDQRKTAIVSAVIGVCHELGFTVVAEGIESPEQAGRLLELGCDRGQGYLFGRPTPIEETMWV